MKYYLRKERQQCLPLCYWYLIANGAGDLKTTHELYRVYTIVSYASKLNIRSVVSFYRDVRYFMGRISQPLVALVLLSGTYHWKR